MTKLVGIDPGKSGAIAYQDENKVKVVKMPEKTLSLHKFITENFDPKVCKIYVERVNMWIEDLENAKKNPAMRGKIMQLQKLFRQYNQLITILNVSGFTSESGNLIEIAAVSWQARLHLRRNKERESYQVHKSRLHKEAKAFFEPMKVIKQNADALLILRYASIMNNIDLIHKEPLQSKLNL